jgi:hypothetical protein
MAQMNAKALEKWAIENRILAPASDAAPLDPRPLLNLAKAVSRRLLVIRSNRLEDPERAPRPWTDASVALMISSYFWPARTGDLAPRIVAIWTPQGEFRCAPDEAIAMICWLMLGGETPVPMHNAEWTAAAWARSDAWSALRAFSTPAYQGWARARAEALMAA